MLPQHRKRQRSSIVSPFSGAPAASAGPAHDAAEPGRRKASLDMGGSSGMQLLSSAAEMDSDPVVRSDMSEGLRPQRSASPRDTPNNSREHQQVLLSATPVL